MATVIHAVAGILILNNQVLMACRPAGKVHAGSWEFPGGKLELDETAAIALVRELKEEIGIDGDSSSCELVTSLYQEYEHAHVKLDVVKVNYWQGDPTALEGQELYWQNLDQTCAKQPLLITTQKILNIIITMEKNKHATV